MIFIRIKNLGNIMFFIVDNTHTERVLKYVFVYKLPATASSVSAFGGKKTYLFSLCRDHSYFLQLMTQHVDIMHQCLYHATMRLTAPLANLNQTNCPNSDWLTYPRSFQSAAHPEWFTLYNSTMIPWYSYIFWRSEIEFDVQIAYVTIFLWVKNIAKFSNIFKLYIYILHILVDFSFHL